MNSKHYLSQSFFLLLFSVLMFSCIEEDDQVMITNPKSEVSFEYRIKGSEDKTFYKVHSSDVLRRRSYWGGFFDSGWGGSLRKSIDFSIRPEIDHIKSIDITQWSIDAKQELLVLKDEEKLNGERGWDYVSTETEIDDFWKRPYWSLIISNHFLFSPSVFEVVKAQKVLVDGVEKTYLEIRFSGETNGIYSADGHIIKNGCFKGVIE